MISVERAQPKFSSVFNKLVLITTSSNWDEPHRIRHQLALALATNGYNVLFIELHSRRQLRSINDRMIAGNVGRKLGIFFLIAMHIPLIQKIAGFFLRNRINKIIRLFGYEKATLINFAYFLSEIASCESFIKKIYVCNDDFENMSSSLSLLSRRLIRRAESLVVASFDVTLAVSPYLVRKLKRSCSRVELLKPAVDFYFVSESIDPPRSRAQNGVLRVAYMGYINDRLDLNTLRSLATTGLIELHMIGPVESLRILEFQREFSSVRWHQPLSGLPLIKFLTTMDVLISPYNLGGEFGVGMTLAGFIPNKLFLYLSSGRPVVLTPLPNLISLPEGLVYTAGGGEEFVATVIRAAANDTMALRSARVKLAEENSWEKRVSVVKEFIH